VIVWLVVRNLRRNVRSGALVVILITGISLIYFMGNSLLRGADERLREAYTESLTGELVIERRGEVTMSLFGANTPVIGEYFTIPELPGYETAREVVGAAAGVAGVTGQVTAVAVADIDGRREGAVVFGVEAGRYFELLPGVGLAGGRYLRGGETGVMITEERAERLAASAGKYPEMGTPVLLTGGGTWGWRIREAPLVGIIRYGEGARNLGEVVITDAGTARALANIRPPQRQQAAQASQASPVFMGAAQASPVFMGAAQASPVYMGAAGSGEAGFDVDALFGEAGPEEAGPEEASPEEASEALSQTGFSPETLAEYLGGFAGEDGEEEEAGSGGDWHFMLVRLEAGAEAARVAAELNGKLLGLGLVAVDWRVGAGEAAIVLFLVRMMFNGGVVLAGVAGVIAVVNILLVGVFRRAGETGTLRAIGAGDWYIRAMVLGENAVLSLAAGILAVGCGYAGIRVVNGLGIAVGNGIIAALAGGTPVEMRFEPAVAWRTVGAALMVGLASSVYPVEAAVRIAPAQAVRRA
jgi:ABC-type lipoprotein release transport system permease subunit